LVATYARITKDIKGWKQPTQFLVLQIPGAIADMSNMHTVQCRVVTRAFQTVRYPVQIDLWRSESRPNLTARDGQPGQIQGLA
jgi:hypothetical protein